MATNRRERQREATKQEIRDAARAQLTAGGPASISLRAIARDMGLTAAALYRYYDSLDALVEDLCADRYDALTAEVLAARDNEATPLDQLREACRVYRRWALRNPHEYALICGEPVIDTMHDHVESTPKGDAAMRFTLAFLEPFTAVWHARTTPPQPLVPGVAEALSGPNVEALRQALPMEGVAFFLIGWTRLAGAITMEIFGHLRWATDDPEPLFEQNLDDMLRQLTL